MDKETKKPNPVSRFSISTNEEIVVNLLEGEGRQSFIDIRLHIKTQEGESLPTEKGVAIPASMLPEIRRMVNLLEEVYALQGFSDEPS